MNCEIVTKKDLPFSLKNPNICFMKLFKTHIFKFVYKFNHFVYFCVFWMYNYLDFSCFDFLLLMYFLLLLFIYFLFLALFEIFTFILYCCLWMWESHFMIIIIIDNQSELSQTQKEKSLIWQWLWSHNITHLCLMFLQCIDYGTGLYSKH